METKDFNTVIVVSVDGIVIACKILQYQKRYTWKGFL